MPAVELDDVALTIAEVPVQSHGDVLQRDQRVRAGLRRGVKCHHRPLHHSDAIQSCVLGAISWKVSMIASKTCSIFPASKAATAPGGKHPGFAE